METDVAPPAPPLPSTTGGLIPPGGGSLFSEIDGTGYTFAAGTFSETVRFTHTVWSNLPPPPDGLISVGGMGGPGRGFAVTALSVANGLPVQPTRPVTVTVEVDGAARGSAIPGTLAVWRLDPGGWTSLPGCDDPASGRVTAAIGHFSQFAVFGETHWLYLPSALREEEGVP
jgi:hypothetical protein